MIPIAAPWESNAWGASSLEDDLAEGDRFYHARGLPTILALPLPLFEGLATDLLANGWKKSLDISVMVRIDRKLVSETASDHRIEISTAPDARWINAHGREIGSQGYEVLTSGSAQFLSYLHHNYLHQDEVVATARVGFAGRWSALGAVRVAPEHRRQGIARALVTSSINLAQNEGFPFMFLQVDCDNHAAVSLYESLGFAHHHRDIYLSRD